jgi:hypothetical protein
VDATLKGVVRRGGPQNYADGEAKTQITQRGDLLVAQALPAKTDLTRLGDTWTCSIATASAFTFVNAWPTTRGELVVYNGESAGGKSYVIESAWMVNITSQAAAQPYCLLAQLVPVAVAPTDDATQLIYGRSGKTSYGGRAKRAVANTAAGQIANKWEIIGNAAVSPMTTNLANAIYVDLFGGWVVPPGGAIALAGVAGTAAGTAILGVTWSEVKIDVTL